MKYIEVLAFPLRWAFFHEVGFELNPFGLQSIVRALALCTGFLGAGLVFYRLNKLIFLFFLAVCISFACEVIYPRELVAIEQRCYLPIAFSAGLLVVGLNLLTTTRPKWSKFFLIGFSLWLAFGASQLVKRVIIYTDPATLFTRELKLYPNSVEALIHSSHINKDAGRYSQAQADLLTVENVVLPRTKVSAWFRRRLNNIFMLRVNLLEANGSADEMQKLVNLCKLYVDSETQCAHHRAQLYIKQGKYDTATRILRLLRVLGWGSIEHDFGLALLALGDKASIQEAGSVLSELFNLNPANIRNANAWLTYLRKTGDMASAQKEKLRAIAAMKRIGVEWRGQLE
jgi:tetratricopeptide (TPR) repeat protein